MKQQHTVFQQISCGNTRRGAGGRGRCKKWSRKGLPSGPRGRCVPHTWGRLGSHWSREALVEAGRAAAVTARCFVAECRMDPPYWKPHAVGFIEAVAVSVRRERINTGDHSAVEQLPQTGPYRPQGRLWPGRVAFGFLRQRPEPLAVCDLLRWRVPPCL